MFINVKIPTDKINNIVDVTRKALDYCREVDAVIADLPPVSKEMDGQRAVDARKEKLDDYAAKKKSMLSVAKESVAQIIESSKADIDAQTTPSGEMISENKDFMLFEHGFIKSPDQLSRLVNKHIGTDHAIPFAMIAEDYAKKNKWGASFEVHTDEGAVRDYLDQVYDVSNKALDFPGGYYDAYVCDPEFLEKVAAAFGVLKNYSAERTSGYNPEESD